MTTTARLKRAVPNERWQLILEFDDGQFRLFDTAILREEKGWDRLASPQHVKRYTVTPDAIGWPAAGTVDAQYLLRRSVPVTLAALEHEVLRLCYQNRAPTAQDQRHHVYEVAIACFSARPFRIGESIGGGHAERGGSSAFSLDEMLAWPAWREHFELAGCGWAIALVDTLAGEPERLLDALVLEACLRNGLPQADR